MVPLILGNPPLTPSGGARACVSEQRNHHWRRTFQRPAAFISKTLPSRLPILRPKGLEFFRTESSRFEEVSVKGQPLLSQTPIFELELRKIHIAIMTGKQKGSGSSGRCEVPTMRTIIFEVYVYIGTPINGNP